MVRVFGVFENLEHKLGPLATFILHSFIVILLIGIALTYTLGTRIKQDVIDHFAEATAIATNTSVLHHLNESDFEKPMKGARYNEFKKFLKSSIYRSSLVKRIKIWNEDGYVVFSDDAKAQGKRFSNPKLQEVLQTNMSVIQSEEDEESEEEHAGDRAFYENLISFYQPIVFPGNKKPVGSFEIYLTKEAFNKHIANTFVIIVISLTLGLGFLYLTLNWFFRRAYNRINKQNIDLIKLAGRYQIKVEELQTNYLETMKALSRAVDAKDHYTAGHSERVARLSVEIAKEIQIKPDEINLLERAARFHDIGKIGIKGSILNKEGKLTDEEYDVIKKHSDIGSEIIGEIGFLKKEVPIIRSHHERWDGKGYPQGLKGKKIPLLARIITIADTYDAMTSNRPHRKALPVENVLTEIKHLSGKQFDPKIVEALLKCCSLKTMVEVRKIQPAV